MPGPVVHILVALVALLLYFDGRHRLWALLLLPFAVLPDIDHFAPFFYASRDILHNVFLLVPPLAIALYGLKTKNKVLYSVALMAGFLLFSHLVLDFFNGGEALFYPLSVTWYGFTNTYPGAHSFAALIPEPLQVANGAFGRVPLFGYFATPGIFGTPNVTDGSVVLLPEPLRVIPSEVFGVVLTFMVLAIILLIERRLSSTQMFGDSQKCTKS